MYFLVVAWCELDRKNSLLPEWLMYVLSHALVYYSAWCEHVLYSMLLLFKVCRLHNLLFSTMSSTEEKLRQAVGRQGDSSRLPGHLPGNRN